MTEDKNKRERDALKVWVVYSQGNPCDNPSCFAKLLDARKRERMLQENGWEDVRIVQMQEVGAALSQPQAGGTLSDAEIDRVLKEAWGMVDPLNPPLPATYARGEYNGIIAALKTVRDNFNRAILARSTADASNAAEDWMRTLIAECAPLVGAAPECAPEEVIGLIRKALASNAATMLDDGAIREIVNQLRDIAINFHDTQQLRARIASVVVPRLKASNAATGQGLTDALREIKGLVCGDRFPRWGTLFATDVTRGKIADIVDEALAAPAAPATSCVRIGNIGTAACVPDSAPAPAAQAGELSEAFRYLDERVIALERQQSVTPAVPVAWRFRGPSGWNISENLNYVRSVAIPEDIQPLYATPADAASEAGADAWQPIETAPKTGRTLLLGYRNQAGNWRTVRGQWMSEAYIQDNWDDPDSGVVGWYETSAEADEAPSAWYIEPTYWMPTPAEPSAAMSNQAQGGANE